MRVLGVDPGTRLCGWGVVDGRPGARPTAVGVGVVRSSPDLDLELRLLELHTAVTALLREHRPDCEPRRSRRPRYIELGVK